MDYHQTDDQGFYSGTFAADASPLEPDVFLIPAGGVLLAPPLAGAGQVARFVGGAWVLLPDMRGVTYWTADGIAHTITKRGVGVPDGAFNAAPVFADFVYAGNALVARTLTLDEVKTREKTEVTKAADNRMGRVDIAMRRALVRLIEGGAVPPAMLATIKKNDLIEDARDAAIVAIDAATTKTAARAVKPAIVWP